MPLGSAKITTMEMATRRIINEITRDTSVTLKANPRLTLEEALRAVNTRRGTLYPDEHTLTKDLHSLFVMMVWKAYAYEHASDPDTTTEECFKFVTKTAYQYMDSAISKTEVDFEGVSRGNVSKAREPLDDVQTTRVGLVNIPKPDSVVGWIFVIAGGIAGFYFWFNYIRTQQHVSPVWALLPVAAGSWLGWWVSEQLKKK